jgi:hypothetical protein
MGFGFTLLLFFIIFPLTIIFLIIWAITRKKIYGKILGYLWLGLIGFIVLIYTIGSLTADKILSKKNYYGEYIIDRNYFKGKQANWQYDNFRFEIKENDSLYFYVTDKERILKTYKGTIKTTDPSIYKSVRLSINMEQPTIHIMKTNPTIYRSAWSFYLVFHSDKFNNMYFRKGSWKPIND